MSLDQVRAVADAVLYEGYLLYPYRASSRKNQSRWQFGVLGPPGAAEDGTGEDPGMQMQCLVAAPDPGAEVTVHLRFLQLQVREAQRLGPAGAHLPVDQVTVGDRTVLTWDEAVEREVVLAPYRLDGQHEQATDPVEVPGGEDVEPLVDEQGESAGRIVRRRWPLTATVRTRHEGMDGLIRLQVSVDNVHPQHPRDKDAAIRTSLIGAHVIVEVRGGHFVSLLDPPEAARAAAGRCEQSRCWPVLAGPEGSTDTVLGAPIILYDHPQVAEQSAGALFDSTEIDEILTLRVMTMTDDEKAEARATDPLARELIDRCDDMTADDLQLLHGILRDPHAPSSGPPAPPVVDVRDAAPPDLGSDVPWWDPEADASVQPGTDAVVIDGTAVARGSLVRVHPSRRADAQDLFFADQVARVTAVLSDVDGEVHVALVLVDDPASDLHDWYGRYFYFSPDELEPLAGNDSAASPPKEDHREESRS